MCIVSTLSPTTWIAQLSMMITHPFSNIYSLIINLTNSVEISTILTLFYTKKSASITSFLIVITAKIMYPFLVLIFVIPTLLDVLSANYTIIWSTILNEINLAIPCLFCIWTASTNKYIEATGTLHKKYTIFTSHLSRGLLMSTTYTIAHMGHL